MKNLLSGALLCVLFIVPVVASAAEFRVGEQSSVAASEQVAGNVYLAGSSVSSAGAVSGDVIAGGGTVTISGPVGGDLMAGAGTLTVLSSITGDARIGGGTTIIQGKVGGDLVAGGGQITVGGPGVGGDMLLAGGEIRIEAPVAGKARIEGGTVYIDSPISGDVKIEAASVTLGSHAVISGNLSYTSEKELVKEDGAVVRGKIDFTQTHKNAASAAALAGLLSVWVLGKFLVLLFAALVIGLLLSSLSKEMITRAAQQPWPMLGIGLVTLVALPALSALACATVVGIPFGILGFLSFGAALIATWIVAPIIVGSMIYHYFSKRDWEISWKTILIGVLVYSIAGLVPIVGWVFVLAMHMLALGVLAHMAWGKVRGWR